MKPEPQVVVFLRLMLDNAVSCDMLCLLDEFGTVQKLVQFIGVQNCRYCSHIVFLCFSNYYLSILLRSISHPMRQ
jgi:hypothetical protein